MAAAVGCPRGGGRFLGERCVGAAALA